MRGLQAAKVMTSCPMQSILSVSFKIDGIPEEGNCPGIFWKMCRGREKTDNWFIWSKVRDVLIPVM